MTKFTKIEIRNTPVSLAPVVGLHCAGATWRQWRGLADCLCDRTDVYLPQLNGPDRVQRRHRENPFSLADEAKNIVEKLREMGSPAHLVGHSYGGAVALHIARHHSEFVASLCLYEPTAFNLLGGIEPRDVGLKDEIRAISAAIQEAIDEDCALFAAQLFTDFWGGLGAWQALDADKQLNMLGWIPKAPPIFAALMNEPLGPGIPSDLKVTLIYGQHTKPHTRRIVEMLTKELGSVTALELAGADHMGPFVFRERITKMVAQSIADQTTVPRHAIQLP